MSSLSTSTKMCWRAVIYARNNIRVWEGDELRTMDDAIRDAEDMVKSYVEKTGKYHYARIECCIVPLYE